MMGAKGNKTPAKKDRCSVGRATLRLDDDNDWGDDYYDYDSIDDYDYCDDDDYKPQARAPLTVNILSRIQQHKQSSAAAAADAVAYKNPKIKRRRGAASTKEQRPAPKNTTDELLLIALLVDVEPRRHRLVRSNSFDDVVDNRRSSNNETIRTAPSLSQRRRRSKSFSHGGGCGAPIVVVATHNNCSSSSTIPPCDAAVHCIQSLLPSGERPSILGVSASMSVFSDKCQAAVLITWPNRRSPPPAQQLLQVTPLVGCNADTALRLQTQMVASIGDDGDCSLLLAATATATSDYVSYWRLSTQLHDRKDEWVQLLEDLIVLGDDKFVLTTAALHTTLTQGCARARMTLGQCLGPYDMMKEHAAKQEEAKGSYDQGAKEQEAPLTPHPSTTTTLKDDQKCLVCFEQLSDMDAQYCQLVSCGHVTCLDCYKAYLQSAANSGQGSIQCAAFQCTVSIGIHDAAHILFDGNNESDTDDDSNLASTFQRLVRFTLERTTPRGARFCPSPNCGRILLNNNNKPADIQSRPGLNLLLCDCGTSLCADCDNGAAHPGVLCAEFTKIREAIDSGKMDNELETVKWVLKNSRPCPNCQYPIQKDGGCNHVRCQKCSNYFCFQCGGEGQLCMAFYCKNTEKYWHNDGDTHYDGNLYKGLEQLVDKYRAYRMTSAKLFYLVEKLNRGSSQDGDAQHLPTNMDGLLTEIQCHQVLQWIHSATISRMMTSDCQVGSIKNSTLQLELVLHVLSLRGLMQATPRIKASRQEALAAVLGLTSRRKRVSVCKQKAKERRGSSQKSNDLSAFDKLFVDQELQELCQMNATKFSLKAKVVIHEAIKSLLPAQAKNATRRRNKGTNGKNDETNIKSVYPLNQREKRPNDPWRKGFASVDDDTAVVGDWSDDGNRSNKSRRSWRKDKTQVSARRNTALEVSSIVVDAGL